MHYSVEEIGQLLKEARRKKGLSQRALGRMVGVPQSHISRIENGHVDLQTSSLIELSRALELELMLVPCPLIPAVQSLIQGVKRGAEQIPAYRLDEEEENG